MAFDNLWKTSFWAHWGPILARKIQKKVISKKTIVKLYAAVTSCKKSETFHELNLDSTSKHGYSQKNHSPKKSVRSILSLYSFNFIQEIRKYPSVKFSKNIENLILCLFWPPIGPKTLKVFPKNINLGQLCPFFAFLAQKPQNRIFFQKIRFSESKLSVFKSDGSLTSSKKLRKLIQGDLEKTSHGQTNKWIKRQMVKRTIVRRVFHRTFTYRAQKLWNCFRAHGLKEHKRFRVFWACIYAMFREWLKPCQIQKTVWNL